VLDSHTAGYAVSLPAARDEHVRRERMPEYRRRKGSTVWHWCRNCSEWPLTEFESVYTKPVSGELDAECRAKEDVGDCRNY
jgi:hypothetical protein